MINYLQQNVNLMAGMMLLQNNIQLLKQGASCLLRKQTDKYGAIKLATKVYTDRYHLFKSIHHE